MKLHELAETLGLSVLPTSWVVHWDEFIAGYDPAGRSLRMSAGVVDELGEHLAMPPRVRDALHAHLRLFDEQPGMNALFQFCCHLLYDKQVHQGVGNWPIFKDSHLPGGNMLYAYVFLAGRRYALQQHGRLGIPARVTDDTLSDIFTWMEDYHSKHGHWGLAMVGWVANYVLRTKLLQLGRLQFVQDTFKPPFRGYRHRSSNAVVMLAREGRKYRADGQFEGENQRLDPNGPWTSTLEVTDTTIRGHVVHPDGCVRREPSTLPADAWEMVFDQGSPAVSVHIPACGPLTFDACRASIEQALAFFPRHFPERPFDVIYCYSWMMDAQLKAYLSADANLVRFLNEFYLFPYPNTSGWQTIERTFGRANIDLARVEARTSLQRAVLDHIRKGGAWRCSGGVIFPSAYVPGNQPYRADAWAQHVHAGPPSITASPTIGGTR
ncbi:acyltransferase domain-containing protein [Phycisphaerales bacterium AB-hyl4]|uniref:Acyltransferase domain-containing protein n=1 Tax=Natronomicrosphaera hydrolytica TaxID=3242702 RepID=A0ABV4U2U9_9BACT